jgi:hypothetical protein
MTILKILPLVALAITAHAQVFHQNFDSVRPPALPEGWTTSRNRSPSGDFVTTSSSPHSDSNAALSVNATMQQSLVSPVFDFSNLEPESLKFFERRSASHNSSLLVEALTGDGEAHLVSDSLKNPGTTSYILRTMKISSSLGGAAQVRIRWRVIGDGTGSSGTLRIDDITLSARTLFDAGISLISFDPPAPTTGDTVRIQALIENAGLRPVGNFTVEFFEDTNGSGTPEPEELLSTATLGETLAPGSKLPVSARSVCTTRGTHWFIVRTNLPQDQNPSNDLARAALEVGLRTGSVVVNEIMYAPVSPEPEWIELYNRSAEQADLRNWKLSNRNTSVRFTVSARQELLPPGEYCVVSRDSALLRSLRPGITAAVVQPPGLPTYLFNNNGDAVVVWDERGLTMDSLRYDPWWGGTGGASLERRDWDSSSLSASNWGTSRDTRGGTPGRMNSLTPLEEDLTVASLACITNPPGLTVVLKNSGRKPASGFSVSLYDDADHDSLPAAEELLGREDILGILAPRDSLVTTLLWKGGTSGKHPCIVLLDYPGDMRTLDNIAFATITLPYSWNALVINEFMYDPLPGSAEYVEILNISPGKVDLSDWKLSDIPSPGPWPDSRTLCRLPTTLGEGEYLVVASDTSLYALFPELRDSAHHSIIRPGALGLKSKGDRIILTDPTGTTIDSLSYTADWHTPGLEDPGGRSLERINPLLPGADRRNWGTCADPSGGTPGRKNSLFTDSPPADVSLTALPNPFSPDGDGRDDLTIIHYRLRAPTAALRLRIFDACGRLARTLADGEPAASRGEIVWDGYTDGGRRARMGIYIILLEATDPRDGQLQTLKGTVVVAVRL